MKYKLGDICDVVSGGTPSRATAEFWDGGNIPWIKIGNIKGKYVDEADEYITQAGLEGSSAKMLSAGTILFTIFATLGEVGVLTVDACTNQAIAGITIKNQSEVLTDYLYYFLKSKKSSVIALGRGVAQNNINLSILRNFEVPIPALSMQKEMVAVLDKTTEVIEARQKQLQKLDELVKARFVEMFGDPVVNTLGWRQALLRDVTSKIGSGATPRGGKESYHAEGIILIRSMNVHDGRFEYKDLAHITDEQAAQLENVTVEEGDVFINITGASVARSCIVPRDTLPARVNQHVAIIRCVRSQLLPTFANNMFLNSRFKGQLLDIGESGGATRQAITKQQLENLTVILPPLDLQEQFAAFVEQTNKSKVAIQKALDEAQLLFDSLMQKHFG